MPRTPEGSSNVRAQLDRLASWLTGDRRSGAAADLPAGILSWITGRGRKHRRRRR